MHCLFAHWITAGTHIIATCTWIYMYHVHRSFLRSTHVCCFCFCFFLILYIVRPAWLTGSYLSVQCSFIEWFWIDRWLHVQVVRECVRGWQLHQLWFYQLALTQPITVCHVLLVLLVVVHGTTCMSLFVSLMSSLILFHVQFIVHYIINKRLIMFKLIVTMETKLYDCVRNIWQKEKKKHFLLYFKDRKLFRPFSYLFYYL